MTTGYSFSDTLPKDVAGNPFIAMIDNQTVANDFSMLKGIATSAHGTGAIRLSHMAIATHTQGSPLGEEDPGVLLMAIHASAPQAQTLESAQFLQLNYGGLVTGTKDFTIHRSGSVAASAAGYHSLYGLYDGLSDVNASVIVHIQLLAITNNTSLVPDQNADGPGIRYVAGNDYYVDLPAMMVSNASRLHFKNEVDASNGGFNWVIWR